MKKLLRNCENRIVEIQKNGTFKTERIITTPQSSHIQTTNSLSLSNTPKKVLNFCSNNYLGLSNHPHIIKKSIDSIEKYGSGLSSVRFICGTQSIHKELEERLALFHGMEECILYPSCFDANGGIFEAVLSSEDMILSDSLNHASIIDGIRLSKAKRYRYKHLDLKDLQNGLQENANIKMIVTDGVFSMDGDIAPIPQIQQIVKQNEALLMMDECHATGFLGQSGKGTLDYFQLGTEEVIINSTLGKAVGGASGGYTTGPKPIIELLRQLSRPYLFSNSLPPAVVGSALGALDIIESSEGLELRQQLIENTKYFRQKMSDLGFELKGRDHPIVPVMLYEASLANKFANALLEEGIYVIGFSYPVVPKGEARIRVQLSAIHTREDLDFTIGKFEKIGRRFEVLK